VRACIPVWVPEARSAHCSHSLGGGCYSHGGERRLLTRAGARSLEAGVAHGVGAAHMTRHVFCTVCGMFRPPV